MSTTTQPERHRGKATIEYPADNELIITREFQAPRDLVFAAISQPEHVRQWYGMSADGMTVCEIDFRVGGKWHYVLAGPPGEDDTPSPGSTWRSIRPDRVVSTESYDNMPGATLRGRR